MQFVDVEQGSKQWYELRKNRIGGSDAPVIMGVSPYSTPYKLWCQKLGLEPETKRTAAMQRGIDLEPVARKEASRILGIEFFPQVVFNEWQIASLDGISRDGMRLLEIKCPGKLDHESAMDGVIPFHYTPQLIHIIHVINIVLGIRVECIDYFSYSETSSKMIPFEQNDTELKKLLVAEKEFWDRIQSLEPPQLTEKDYTNKENDYEWMLLADEWKDIKKKRESLEAREDVLRDKLIDLSDGKNCLGYGIKTQRILRKGAVDYKAIPELIGVNLEQHRKPSVETWRIT